MVAIYRLNTSLILIIYRFIVMVGKVMCRDDKKNYHTAREHEFLGSLYGDAQITSAKAPDKVAIYKL